MLAGCALGGEPSGDRGVPQALAGQGSDPLHQCGVVRQLVDPGHRAEQVSVGLLAAGPGHRGVDALGGAVGGDLDGLDDDAEQPLAVGHGGRRRGPQRRDVAGQGADRGQFRGREPGRAAPLVPLVLLAEVRPLGQRGFPLALERAAHQAVLRLGQLVLAPGPVAGKVRAFQPLPPDPVHLGPAVLDLRQPGTPPHLHKGSTQSPDNRINRAQNKQKVDGPLHMRSLAGPATGTGASCVRPPSRSQRSGTALPGCPTGAGSRSSSPRPTRSSRPLPTRSCRSIPQPRNITQSLLAAANGPVNQSRASTR